MRVLSHRGFWATKAERNRPEAFRRSFAEGFGTELDLRDLAGSLVVSHDPPQEGAMLAAEMLGLHARLGPDLTLALNIKADGLQALLRPLLDRFSVADAFVFDMSIPDTLHWLRADVPVFTRHSDVEETPVLYREAAGVWLDGFRGDWWSADTVRRHLDAGKRVCIVSPDLHGRDPRATWEALAAKDLPADGRVMICTDHPVEARELFNSAH